MNAALEGLQLRRCTMLLAYSQTRSAAVTPGQTRQALLQVSCPETETKGQSKAYVGMRKTQALNGARVSQSCVHTLPCRSPSTLASFFNPP